MLSTKELIKAVKVQSGYNLYEVEDVLDAFVKVVTDTLKRGEGIKIEQLFSFAPQLKPSANYNDPSTGEVKKSKEKIVVKLKETKHLKLVLNTAHEEVMIYD